MLTKTKSLILLSIAISITFCIFITSVFQPTPTTPTTPTPTTPTPTTPNQTKEPEEPHPTPNQTIPTSTNDSYPFILASVSVNEPNVLFTFKFLSWSLNGIINVTVNGFNHVIEYTLETSQTYSFTVSTDILTVNTYRIDFLQYCGDTSNGIKRYILYETIYGNFP